MILLGTLALYLVLFVGACVAFSRRAGARGAAAFALAAVFGIVLFAAEFVAFEAVLAHFREAPAGGERRGESRETYIGWSRVGFVAFYVVALGGAAALAGALARALGTDARRNVALVVTAFVPFLALTYYPVEVANACAAGEPLFWPNYIDCG